MRIREHLGSSKGVRRTEQSECQPLWPLGGENFPCNREQLEQGPEEEMCWLFLRRAMSSGRLAQSKPRGGAVGNVMVEAGLRTLDSTQASLGSYWEVLSRDRPDSDLHFKELHRLQM